MRTQAFLVFLTLGSATLEAQTVPPATAAPSGTGSISGRVLDAGDGSPVPDFQVYLSSMQGEVPQGNTDAQGRYLLHEIPQGKASVTVINPDYRVPLETKTVNVPSGGEVTSVDFHVYRHGTISGRVLNDEKEPVASVLVSLISKRYVGGKLTHYVQRQAWTDSEGRYSLPYVEANQPAFLFARRAEANVPAKSDTSEDAQLRKSVLMPTWYYNSTEPSGAEALIIHSGEDKRDVEIVATRSPGYCMQGKLTAEGVPAALQFEVADEMLDGRSTHGEPAVKVRTGSSGPDGQIRVCDLYPGRFRITATRSLETASSPPEFGAAIVSILDRDVQSFAVDAEPPVAIQGTVAEEDSATQEQTPLKFAMGLMPLSAAPPLRQGSVRGVLAPGSFSLSGTLMTDYSFSFGRLPGVYVKDVIYGGVSILHKPFEINKGVPLAVTLSRNGAVIKAQVVDNDGTAVPDVSVLVLPAKVNSGAELSAAMISGITSYDGSYTSEALAPGSYYVLATNERIDLTEDNVTKLLKLRSRGREVELEAKAAAQITLTPISIR
jgi:5-hydroxyisourate hydrolase-like protein (transthyretin family)